MAHDLSGSLPRLFYNLNKKPFNPETHFSAIAESLNILNPKIKNLNFKWKRSANGWNIDISNNPQLNDITPLCGLNILVLDASYTGSPDLALLTETNIVELKLEGADLNHLLQLKQMKDLQALDISKTRIRNLSNIIKYPNLATLDISGIEELEISQQLIWNRKLKMLTVSESFRNDPTLKILSNRGVIIIYTAD
jgi:hypothetical protein